MMPPLYEGNDLIGPTVGLSGDDCTALAIDWQVVCHGLCASCHEVRHFLTFVADDEIKKVEEGSYLRHGIISTNGETNLIQEATYNVDINTETMHGKDTR
jgi:hypothetical protein